jgi:hypothetical protein
VVYLSVRQPSPPQVGFLAGKTGLFASYRFSCDRRNVVGIYFKCFSNSLNIREYSSAQLEGSLNPWLSTGYTAISQFSFSNSISRCDSLTTS